MADTTHDAYGRSSSGAGPRKHKTVYWWHKDEGKWYPEHFADPKQLRPQVFTTTDELPAKNSLVDHLYVLNEYGFEPFKEVRIWEGVKFKDFNWPRGRFKALTD